MEFIRNYWVILLVIAIGIAHCVHVIWFWAPLEGETYYYRSDRTKTVSVYHAEHNTVWYTTESGTKLQDSYINFRRKYAKDNDRNDKSFTYSL